MERLRMRVDPHEHDPDGWGHSLANLAELLVGCLDAAEAQSVMEVGAYAGDLTQLLLEWAAQRDATVMAVDPAPQAALERLARERPDLHLVREASVDALQLTDLSDAIVIDGDHNYWTVSEELRIIGERSPETLPLLLFHDVAWPHARRDAYYTPETIPEEHRQPMTQNGGLLPGEPGTRLGGLPYPWPAARGGGPRNGVLTAIEDFVAGRDGVRLAVVDAFFGFGAVWSLKAPYAPALAELLDPWDGNTLLRRLEDNRVHLLARMHDHQTHATLGEQRNARTDAVLRRLLESRSFAVAERLARWRRRGTPDPDAVTRDEIRRALVE
jgi:hypothetical protein